MWLQFTFFIISSDFFIAYVKSQGDHNRKHKLWLKPREMYTLIVLKATGLIS